MDRTKEFLKLAGDAAVAPLPPSSSSVTTKRVPPTPETAKRERSQQAKFFNQKAAEVSKGIANCSVLLSRLTMLARSQTLFNENDESTQVNQI
jgi:hypothetical protein